MKISELITKLETAQSEHGDLDIATYGIDYETLHECLGAEVEFSTHEEDDFPFGTKVFHIS